MRVLRMDCTLGLCIGVSVALRVPVCVYHSYIVDCVLREPRTPLRFRTTSPLTHVTLGRDDCVPVDDDNTDCGVPVALTLHALTFLDDVRVAAVNHAGCGG